MNYKEVLDFFYDRLPMFQRTGPAAYKDNLENTVFLDNQYKKPHLRFKSIHVAGTNGKGSVSHMLAAIFQSAGYKTGLYTSPHLTDFRERIRVDGKMIPEEEVIKWGEEFIINNNLWKIEPSFFEITVALAFDYFAKESVDIALIEVGLGGRLDSTNIITPELSIITNIGLDHTAILGNTLEKIAIEKAGIVKPGIPVVVGTTHNETQTVFKNISEQNHSKLYFADQEYTVSYSMLNLEGKQVLSVEKNGLSSYPKLALDLTGMYQKKNIPIVLKAVDLMTEKGWSIEEKAVYEGLANVSKLTGLRGRWQTIGHNPLIICDAGHNEDGIIQVVDQLKQTPYKKLHFVVGLVTDKDPGKVLSHLPENGIYYFTKADIPRALDEKLLKEKATLFHLKGDCYPTVAEAMKTARKRAEKEDLIFVGGSSFIVAEILP